MVCALKERETDFVSKVVKGRTARKGRDDLGRWNIFPQSSVANETERGLLRTKGNGRMMRNRTQFIRCYAKRCGNKERLWITGMSTYSGRIIYNWFRVEGSRARSKSSLTSLSQKKEALIFAALEKNVDLQCCIEDAVLKPSYLRVPQPTVGRLAFYSYSIAS